MPAYLRLLDLDKRFGELHVLAAVSLEVEEGEILALLGPSGSGKTTLLRLLAGFERPDAGRVELGGRNLTPLASARRRFGMVFQHYALFPHLDVGENVAFGLEPSPLDAAGVRRRVAEMLELVDLAGFERRRVSQLSGGQQQRVALARALAPEPRMLLLDEPLSNLDPTLRERTRRQLKEAIRRIGITTVFVTHEQEEAFDLGGRVAVLERGRLHQVGRPEELYLEPATRFVASFVGRSTVLAGRGGEDGSAEVARGAQGETVTWAVDRWQPQAQGRPVELVVRPEGLALVAPTEAAALPGRVVDRRYAGPLTYYTVALQRGDEAEVLAHPDAAREGDEVGVAPCADGPRPWLFRSDDPPAGERRVEA